MALNTYYGIGSQYDLITNYFIKSGSFFLGDVNGNFFRR
jgi:hypothetical protein